MPKKPWEVITAADLKNAKPGVKEGDVVVIVTGWHHKYSDALEYYGEAPGLSKEAAEWLVSMKPKMVAIDTPFIDHPMATSMANHRGGPQMKRLTGEYIKATGLDPKKEHPEWNIAGRTILGAGIPVRRAGGRRRGRRQGQARHHGRHSLEVRARGRLPGADGRACATRAASSASKPVTDHPRRRKEPADGPQDI